MAIDWPTGLFIDGAWQPGSGGDWPVVNPATGDTLARVAVADAGDVDRAVRAARRAFDDGPWPRLDPLERGRILHRLADVVRRDAEALALTDTLNVGKPIRDTRGFDVPCAADLFESYAGLADKIAGKCYGTLPENVTMQFREPLGVVAAVVPWNFPLTNAAIKLAPLLACGNTCVLKPSEVSPLLVSAARHDELLDRILDRVRKLRQGDPTDPANQLGCLATPQHRATVERLVGEARAAGARCVLGGTATAAGGAFYPPTVFDRLEPQMVLARQEVFGPVLGVLTFREEDEAVRLANDCDFGLMANVWTADGTRALRVARRLRAGRVAINGGGPLRPNVPVFGYKMSGIGAELGFDEAVHEYTNSKAVLYSLVTEPGAWPD